MVLDSVVRAAIEHLRDVSPPVVKQPVHQEENPLLFTGPATLLDLRVQMIVPALTALLADSSRQVLGDRCPLLRPVLLN